MDDTGDEGTQVSVLGRIEMRLHGRDVDLGTPRQRSIVAALALAEGRAVSFDAVVARVWGDHAPPTATGTMQRYVASLRGALEPGRGADQPPSVLVTEGSAYALRIPGGCRDIDRFHEGVTQARRLLSAVPDPLRPAVTPALAAEVGSAHDLLDRALRLWRGEPYADLGDHDPQVAAERARLEDVRASAVELRIVALMALGRHAETIGDLESMTARHPLHERSWALRAVALVRSGRQAEALEVLGSLRSMLADELGVDPSPPLQRLYADILRQDPSVSWRSDPAAGDAPAVTARPHPPRAPSARPAPPSPRWPLVGRTHESGLLARVIDEARRGVFPSALVTGEAGVGKTRLVQELMLTAHVQGATVALGRCCEHAPALWPIQTALEAIGGETASACDAARLQTRPDDFDTWQRVVHGLRRAADAAPVLLVVEDVQWADTATLRLLEHLVAEPDMGALGLVLTRRTGDGEDRRMSRLAAAVARAEGLRLDLDRLPAADARRLALAVNDELTDPDSVCRRSGGNALFVAELALAGGRVGGGLADVVRTRAATLDDAARTALELASTVDGPFDLDLLGAMLACGPEEAERALEPALRAGLVRTDDAGRCRFSFEHEVVREVLRGDLPIATRARCREVADRLRAVRDARLGDDPAGLADLSARSDQRIRSAGSWPTVLTAMRGLDAPPDLAARAS